MFRFEITERITNGLDKIEVEIKRIETCVNWFQSDDRQVPRKGKPYNNLWEISRNWTMTKIWAEKLVLSNDYYGRDPFAAFWQRGHRNFKDIMIPKGVPFMRAEWGIFASWGECDSYLFCTREVERLIDFYLHLLSESLYRERFGYEKAESNFLLISHTVEAEGGQVISDCGSDPSQKCENTFPYPTARPKTRG